MDAECFDSFARTFGQTRSRRQALRGLAGAATAALALGGREASAGKCKRKGTRCTKSSQCCTENCTRGKCRARCGVLPPQAVTISFSPIVDFDSCTLGIHLRGFASNTTYTVDITVAFADGSESTVQESVTTDGCGSADFTPFEFFPDTSVRAEVDGVSSGALEQVACGA